VCCLGCIYAGIEKLKKHFKEYDLPIDQLDKRVTIVCGDLEKERFGLDQSSFCSLGDSVSSIYHLGAHVNHILGYEALRYDIKIIMCHDRLVENSNNFLYVLVLGQMCSLNI